MKTIQHFHWNLPGPLRLFGAGFWLAVGAALGYPTGANLNALLGELVEWLSRLVA